MAKKDNKLKSHKPSSKKRVKYLEKRFDRFEKTTTDQLQQLSDRVAALLRKTSKKVTVGK